MASIFLRQSQLAQQLCVRPANPGLVVPRKAVPATGLTGQYFGRTWGILRTGPFCHQYPEPKGYLQPLTHIQGAALGTGGEEWLGHPT